MITVASCSVTVGRPAYQTPSLQKSISRLTWRNTVDILTHKTEFKKKSSKKKKKIWAGANRYEYEFIKFFYPIKFIILTQKIVDGFILFYGFLNRFEDSEKEARTIEKTTKAFLLSLRAGPFRVDFAGACPSAEAPPVG